MNRRKLAAAIDQLVARVDRDAVRRARGQLADRFVDIFETDGGMAAVNGVLLESTGKALDQRLNELASTVCQGDPRSQVQRRADALGALATKADQLTCTCGGPACPASARKAPPTNVVIHVVAQQSSLDGRSNEPAYQQGSMALIPADVLRELAVAARQLPIIPPLDAEAERRYTPSRALADFIRCRDLTCRAPGCDQPAINCDIDHTVPYPTGPTHASNLKCLCRKHHLMKTFWGWQDRQLPDGTVIWTLPDGQVHVTTSGSALLFPALCVPTGTLPEPPAHVDDRCRDRRAMMPHRTRTRAQHRAQAIADERRQNAEDRRLTSQRMQERLFPKNVEFDPDDPPPF